MWYLPAILLVSVYSSVVLGAMFHGADMEAYPEHRPNDVNQPGGMDMKLDSSQNAYLDWIRYLVRQQKQAPTTVTQQKRFTDFTMPYLKYKVDKRNNGIWIWMPAQGYVSVPHQDAASADDITKQGKIMRYG